MVFFITFASVFLEKRTPKKAKNSKIEHLVVAVPQSGHKK